MQNKMIEKLVQYTHLEKLYGYLPGMDGALQARLFGLSVEAYREIRDRFDEGARDAALGLLADDSFAGRVDRLPFRAGQTIVGVGDSITDDLQSWLEIVRHLLEERRSQDGIRVVNVGLSAHTTAMVLRPLHPECGHLRAGLDPLPPGWQRRHQDRPRAQQAAGQPRGDG